MRVKAAILAAGRGSRLGLRTAKIPKCMLTLGGEHLLDRQISSLNRAGITSITVVTGYRREVIEERGIPTIYNRDWHCSNMVNSLICAMDSLNADLIVSYSDIVYESAIVSDLLDSQKDIAIAYDPNWRHQWAQRFDDPLDDAESFGLNPAGLVTDIGRKVRCYDEISGQFMGLIKLSAVAQDWIRTCLSEHPGLRPSLDMTHLLSLLIDSGRDVDAVANTGFWCEIDSERDLVVARQRYEKMRTFHSALR